MKLTAGGVCGGEAVEEGEDPSQRREAATDHDRSGAVASPSAAEGPPSVAGTESLLWGDGPDGRLASWVARGTGAEVGADGVGGRCPERFLWAFL